MNGVESVRCDAKDPHSATLLAAAPLTPDFKILDETIIYRMSAHTDWKSCGCCIYRQKYASMKL